MPRKNPVKDKNKEYYPFEATLEIIVLFVKKLEDNSRRIMEITECEILADGSRTIHTLYRYHVTENRIVDGRPVIRGEFRKVSPISASLQKRLLENGMPASLLERLTEGENAA